MPQLAVVLLSLPLKSCGWDLTDVSFARVTAESTRTPPRWSQSGVPAMSSMTTCNQVAFNLPSATRSNRREPLAGWYTVVRIKAGVLGSVPALAYPKAAGLCLTLTSSPPCLAVRKGTHSQALAAQAHSWHSELPRVRVPSARSSSAARSELVGAPQPGVPELVGAPQLIARLLSLAG